MRALILVLISAANLLGAPAALAGIPGVMGPTMSQDDLPIVLAIVIITNLVCLAMLLPDFDGMKDEDWKPRDDDGRR